MKKIVLSLGLLLPVLPGFCQLSVGGAETMTIRSGTEFVTDSLVLVPSSDLQLSNNAIVKITNVVGGLNSPLTSISRVYQMAAPVTYSGVAGIQYQDSELGANVESDLQFAYDNAAGIWITGTTTTVNTATNYLNIPLSNITMQQATAVTGGVVLPVACRSFSARREGGRIVLRWETNGGADLTGSEPERSSDGRSWQKMACLPAENATTTYRLDDYDLNFDVRYYRIALLGSKGGKIYTHTATIRREGAASTAPVVQRNGNGIGLLFPGDAPEGIRVYDMSGRLVWCSSEAFASYWISGLAQGTYLLRYRLSGKNQAQTIVF